MDAAGGGFYKKIPAYKADKQIGRKRRHVTFEDDLECHIINAHIHNGLQ
jgi:hypothetical protein